jgi:hypothetical protein
MYLKKIFFITIFILPSFCFAQNLERKGKFFFNVGPEYRITPIYKLNNYSSKAFYTNVDMQNSGVSLNLGVNYYITENLSFGFKNSFRYDLITLQDNVDFSGSGISNSVKGVLIGYHFGLIYHFQVFKKGDLLVSAGVSLLNRNSEFSVQEQVFDDNGQLLGTVSSLVDYKYSANKLSLGYANGKSKLMVGLYITRNSGYFEETTTFMVPFVNYSFDFGKL